MGKAKGTEERSLSCKSGSGLVGAGRSTVGRRFPGGGSRARPANLAPPRRAPLTRGTQSAASPFFLFQFLPPLPGRQRPLSPAAAPAVRLHPLPAPLTSARLLFAPALLSPLLHDPAPLGPNNRLGEQPKTAAGSEA